jgi:hypothetical protein
MVWVPVPEHQRKIIGPHRSEAIYLGYDSPNIVQYMDPSTGAILKARFANCKFVEDKFPTPPVDMLNKQVPLTFQAPETLTMKPHPWTALAETEVTKLLNLHDLAEQIPKGFFSGPRVLHNLLPETYNILPAKRHAPSTSKRQRMRFTTKVTPNPLSLAEAKASPEWPEWSKTLETEYALIRKQKVFREVSIELTKSPVGHKPGP